MKVKVYPRGPMGPAATGIEGDGNYAPPIPQSDVTGLVSALANKQAVDADLTTIAAIDSTQAGGAISTIGAGWVYRSWSQIKTLLGLTKSDVGLGNVDNTSDANKPVSTAQAAADALKVDKALYDANTILASTTDNTPAALTVGTSTIVGRAASGGIAALTVSDVKTLLGLTDEDIQDLIGAMVAGNTETNITVTYDDTTGKLNFVASGGGGGGGATVFDDLTDVDLTGLVSGQIVQYDGAAWVVHTLAKSDVGLSNVDNTADTAKPVSTAQQTALDAKLDKSLYDANTVLYATTDNTPAALTVGASTVVGRDSTGGIAALTMSALKTLLALVKGDVGLGNVDNTSDANKPVSTAQAAADALKIDKSTLDANTVLYATADDTPAALAMGASTIVARLASGNIVAATTAQLKTLLAIAISDVASLQASLDAKVAASLYDANTILAATTDDTPAALTVGASTFVGRKASGGITAMTVSDVLTLLSLTTEDLQDLVGAMVNGGTETGISVTYDDTNGRLDFVVDDTAKVAKSLFDANTILYATTDNTPVALTVGASTFVGRKATGDISAMSVSEVQTLITVPNGKGYVNHGSTAGTARPSGFASIEWLGTVEPTNAVNGDSWINA